MRKVRVFHLIDSHSSSGIITLNRSGIAKLIVSCVVWVSMQREFLPEAAFGHDLGLVLLLVKA